MIRSIAIAAWAIYAVGLHWIYISLHDFGAMPWWLSGIATLLLAGYVALYAVFAALLIKRLWPGLKDPLTPWICAASITLFEWLRGTLLTGFPWLSVGYLAIDTPLAGYAPIVGVYGVGFVVALCVVWLIQVVRYRRVASFVYLSATVIAGWVLLLTDWTTPHGKPLRVALIQGAIEQSMKFDPSREESAFQTHLKLGSISASPGATHLIVFPETALVRPLEFLPADRAESLRILANRAQASVMIGAPMRTPLGYTNSVFAIRPQQAAGEVAFRYDKHHLVPFGEFIPPGFRWFVDMMNMPLGDFQRGPAVQPPFEVQDQRIGVNICFEDLFGEELIRPLSSSIAEELRPTILLNVSNLAWFGKSIALSQHLTISRMRAIETGRPMIRATNTGATAAIDAKGRVTDELEFATQGILSARVQGMQGQTPYTRVGNQPIVLLSIGLIALAWFFARRRRKASQ